MTRHIGIGTPIAERPSHTTGRTGHVYGDSADPRKRDCSANRQVQIQGNESPSDSK